MSGVAGAACTTLRANLCKARRTRSAAAHPCSHWLMLAPRHTQAQPLRTCTTAPYTSYVLMTPLLSMRLQAVSSLCSSLDRKSTSWRWEG